MKILVEGSSYMHWLKLWKKMRGRLEAQEYHSEGEREKKRGREKHRK